MCAVSETVAWNFENFSGSLNINTIWYCLKDRIIFYNFVECQKWTSRESMLKILDERMTIYKVFSLIQVCMNIIHHFRFSNFILIIICFSWHCDNVTILWPMNKHYFVFAMHPVSSQNEGIVHFRRFRKG